LHLSLAPPLSFIPSLSPPLSHPLALSLIYILSYLSFFLPLSPTPSLYLSLLFLTSTCIILRLRSVFCFIAIWDIIYLFHSCIDASVQTGTGQPASPLKQIAEKLKSIGSQNHRPAAEKQRQTCGRTAA
jgi:hypothetical protein